MKDGIRQILYEVVSLFEFSCFELTWAVRCARPEEEIVGIAQCGSRIGSLESWGEADMEKCCSKDLMTTEMQPLSIINDVWTPRIVEV